MLRNIKRFFEMHGFDPVKFVRSFIKLPRFFKDYTSYKDFGDTTFPVTLSSLMPVLCDYRDNAGVITGHYVHQDLWAAKKIYSAKPGRHVDIGSRIDGFVTALLSYRTVEVIDIRPLQSPYDNLVFIQDNACEMKNFKDGELESVSCLHAMEHFGLGRYGDPIDPYAYKAFAKAISRVVKKGGIFYLSVPIGKQKLAFNAHRIFSPQTILDLFNDFDLENFAAVNDEGLFVPDAQPTDFANSNFSCGLFEFRKRGSHV